MEDAQARHAEILEDQVKSLEKHIANLNLELKATRDDLSKAKAGLEAALALETTLRAQIEQKDAEVAGIVIPRDQSEEVGRLSKELANARDDLLNIQEAFKASKESFQQISGNHQAELEEAARVRAEEVTRIKAEQAEREVKFKEEKGELAGRISELEVEVATLKAAAEAQPAAAPATPRKEKDANGTVPGVTKEELQRMHEAHNLKVYEMEATHEQAMKVMKEQLEAAAAVAEEHKAMAERLQMEVTFAEQSAEDSENDIKQYVRVRFLLLSACFGVGYLYWRHAIPMNANALF